MANSIQQILNFSPFIVNILLHCTLVWYVNLQIRNLRTRNFICQLFTFKSYLFKHAVSIHVRISF